jgi:hypothetical protein
MGSELFSSREAFDELEHMFDYDQYLPLDIDCDLYTKVAIDIR